ncbi:MULTISPECIES: D-alanine--D-alanine ligase [unclassified Pseudomonas]|uniref:D-alanine--D-alanine ligase n=1 Tax=unclassified Pseudomonas TaxID=196821 RepID=UPI000BCF1A21|nr:MULTISPECIES: D-alanine--D-alanine ligase [unclassified Pseudomonas]PVZ19845.1 D-alanine-D-alanine ligase [Pseudomonas sp. URIL14HWK12:I12]PVZ26911.1 D-alanine-D-alanine ligase [Pseudomonas sp. URIL14HWK12:I10]PVZ37800.1 D-alanine-D-alanine ligase [Pseudomonas sp. URIL14HWK12:I11]SNZ05618.1 D-alanine-D-alanine ligase [Pseudomonas sp. URIL14HWK12:I9]
MSNKIRVGIVFGGRSAEHEVSLQSARNVLEALDRERFEPVMIGIDKHGHWHLCSTADYLLNPGDPAHIALNPSHREVALRPGDTRHSLEEAGAPHALAKVDVLFPLVHGTQGEDGCLQGLLRMLDLPFVGSDVLGSAICMDKDVAKRLLREAGLPVTPSLTVRRHRSISFAHAQATLGMPVFVKPANSGSSVGVSRVEDAPSFEAALAEAWRYDDKLLIEAAVQGREIECAVLGNESPVASGCGEIVIGQGFYSYETKYIDDQAAQVVVPAAIDEAASKRIRALALQAYEVLECTGLARVDVFLQADGQVLINELNTLPGFTRISMYPKLWQAAGLSYTELVSRLLDLALARHQGRRLLATSR